MTRKSLAALAAAAMFAGGASSADAAKFIFTSSVPLLDSFSVVTGSGTITTDDTVSTSFDGNYTGYAVRSITGTYDGLAITGLTPANVKDGNDNLVNTSGGLVDYDGIGFQLAGIVPGYLPVSGFLHTVINLYGYNGTYYDNGPTDGGSFTLTAVPEPATWAMMIVGLGGVGYALRRRRSPIAGAAMA